MRVDMVDVFCIIYENRSMKPVKIVLGRGSWGKREIDGTGKFDYHTL
jgi:hypothetical protein